MMYVICGLGNPGEEYRDSRHNVGRMAVEYFRKAQSLPDFHVDKSSHSLVSKGDIGGNNVTLVLPDGFMNKSGASIAVFVKTAKAVERLTVVHDDIDMPLGKFKLSFNRGAGGHKGVESIMKALKTEGFVRLRIGICPATPAGKLRKPSDTTDFVIKKFSPKEKDALRAVLKRADMALGSIVADGRERAMNLFN